jgi:Tfp pilus assembly protein PilX
MAPTDTCAPLWEGPEPGKNGSYWHDAKNDSGQNVISFADAQLSLTPFYIVELISTHAPCDPANPSKSLNCKRFRVTSASRDANGRAKVILQSIYATK